jgi:hypothetical protein
MFLNIDYPTGLATAHQNHCRHVLERRETPLKGDGSLKADGGWLPFDSLEGVHQYLTGHSQQLELQRCGNCMGAKT